MTTNPARRLSPRLTLLDVFGPGVAYVRRTSPSVVRWLPTAVDALELLSGGQTAIAGPMPVVCSAATATPEILALLHDAGLPVVADLSTYRDVPEYLARLDAIQRSGLRLALQTAHAAHEVDPRRCLVDPEVGRDLNDKGRLAEWVPAGLVPSRTVVRPDEVPAATARIRAGRAVVLKAANRLPSGAGESVRICRTPAEVEAAQAEMAGEPRVVVEDWLDIARSACLHFVVRRDGRVEPLGTAEQVSDDRGRWLGNWLDADSDALVSPRLLAEVAGVVERAALHGYRGFAGIDVAFTAEGGVFVLDLNFRMNGSTAAALLRAAVDRDRGARAIRSRSWRGTGDFAGLLRVARSATERGTLVPLALYDPAACATGGVPRLSGLLIGASRDAVREEERRLAAEGVV